MDINGGRNPSNPRLDGVGSRPVPGRPNQPQANLDSVQSQNPVSFDSQPEVTGIEGLSVSPPTIENPVPSQTAPAAAASPANIVDSATKPGKKKGGAAKKVLIVLAAILGIGAIAGGAYYVGFTMGTSNGRKLADADYQKQQAEAQRLEAEEEEESGSSDQELSLGDLIEPKYVDETIDGEVGKQAQASDGFVLKVVNIERNFKTEDPNYKLDTSKELIKVNFLMGNVDKSKAKDISSFNFRLENSSKALLTPENIASYEGKFDTVKLDPGGQASGSIVYAVNKDEKPLSFIREQRYRISGENREVTTKIVVVVAKQ